MDPDRMEAFVGSSSLLEQKLVQEYGAGRLAVHSWTITSCQHIDETTRRPLFPDEPAWTASMTRVTEGNLP